MSVEFNHTIVEVRDQDVSGAFWTDILGLPEPGRFGPFTLVETDNDVSLDLLSTDEPIEPRHYCFLVSEDEFDAIHGRIRDRGLTTWADPGRRREGEINHNDGGRGVYWQDPDGHLLEVITRPYGSGA